MTRLDAALLVIGHHDGESASSDGLYPVQQRRVQLVRSMTGDDDLDNRFPPDAATTRGDQLQQPGRDPPDLTVVQHDGRIVSHQTDHAATLPQQDRPGSAA